MRYNYFDLKKIKTLNESEMMFAKLSIMRDRNRKNKIGIGEPSRRRSYRIILLRSKGLTLDQIGIRMGICKERVRQLIATECKVINRELYLVYQSRLTHFYETRKSTIYMFQVSSVLASNPIEHWSYA